MRQMLAFLLMLLPGGVAGTPVPLPNPVEADRALAAICRHLGRFFTSYRGVRSRRTTLTRERDPETGRLLESRRAEHLVLHDFYRAPTVTTLRCEVNGEAAEPTRCSERWLRLKPHVPIFDAEGQRQYRLDLVGVERLDGRRCYRVDVVPRVRSVRHFQGQLWVETDTLALLQMEGTIAERPFFLRHLYFKLRFRDLGAGRFDAQSGYVDAWLRVPLFYKRRITTWFSATQHVPLAKGGHP